MKHPPPNCIDVGAQQEEGQRSRYTQRASLVPKTGTCHTQVAPWAFEPASGERAPEVDFVSPALWGISQEAGLCLAS